MTTGNNPGANPVPRQLVITRIFDAPRALVWQAWTVPEHLMRWWGPKDSTSPMCQLDLRVGGKYLFAMRTTEGQEFYATGTFREVVPPERLVFTDNFSDEHGNIISAAEYGMNEDFPSELLITVVLEDLDGKTHLTLTHTGIPAGEMSEQTAAGWNESFDKLAATLI